MSKFKEYLEAIKSKQHSILTKKLISFIKKNENNQIEVLKSEDISLEQLAIFFDIKINEKTFDMIRFRTINSEHPFRKYLRLYKDEIKG